MTSHVRMSNRKKIAGIEQWSLKLEITRPSLYFQAGCPLRGTWQMWDQVSGDLWQHHGCHGYIRDNNVPVTDTPSCDTCDGMPSSMCFRLNWMKIKAKSCTPCSCLSIVKKGEKNSMQKSIWVTVLQYIRLNRVSVAHQPGKWVILKSAMSGLNINVSHKSSWMLSS